MTYNCEVYCLFTKKVKKKIEKIKIKICLVTIKKEKKW